MGRSAIVIPLVCVLLLSVGCRTTEWEEKYLEKEQENRALQEAYDHNNQKLAEKDATADVLRRELGETQAQIDALAEEVDGLGDRPATEPVRDEAYEKLLADYERLKARYGDLVRITKDGNLEITLLASVTFASGSYNLTSQGKKALDEVARELTTEFATNPIKVIGHTDTDPIKKSPFKDNLELGGERAYEVIRYLAKQGVDRARMTGASRGELDPVADNTTAAGKKRNRRVEIVVVMPKGVSFGQK